MPISGYEAVYRDLNGTEDAKDALRGLFRSCKRIRIASWDFRVDKDPTSGMARTCTVWRIQFGSTEIDFRSPEYSEFRIDFEKALEGVAEKIVQDNFGRDKQVKTRNCCAQTVLYGRRAEYGARGGRKDKIRSYEEALLGRAVNNKSLKEAREEAQNRIVGEMIRIRESDEWAQRRLQALKDAALKEVAEVFMKYKDLSSDFLDEAVQHGIVACVMNS
jgi:hypothetical protein